MNADRLLAWSLRYRPVLTGTLDQRPLPAGCRQHPERGRSYQRRGGQFTLRRHSRGRSGAAGSPAREPSPGAQPGSPAQEPSPGAQPRSPAQEPSSGAQPRSPAPRRPGRPTAAQRLVISVPGVNDTPRSTSPNPAARMVLKLSAGDVTAASLSVTATSLLGSAPWSPPPLTVEVTAQMVTVPPGLTRPVMLRRPSVAGAQGSPVAGLFPVG